MSFETKQEPVYAMDDVDHDQHRMNVAIEQLAVLERICDKLQVAQGVDHTTAQTLRTVTTGMESMDRHFQTYPVRSYTIRPSKTNYSATLESVASLLIEGVKKVVKAIFNFIIAVFQSIGQLAKKVWGLFGKTKRVARNSAAIIEANGSLNDIFNVLSESDRNDLNTALNNGHMSTLTKLKTNWNGLVEDLSTESSIARFWTLGSNDVYGHVSIYNTYVLRLLAALRDSNIEPSELANFANDGDMKHILSYGSPLPAVTELFTNSVHLAITISDVERISLQFGEMLGRGEENYLKLLKESARTPASLVALQNLYDRILQNAGGNAGSFDNSAIVLAKDASTVIRDNVKALTMIYDALNKIIGAMAEYHKARLDVYIQFAKKLEINDEARKEVERVLATLKSKMK